MKCTVRHDRDIPFSHSTVATSLIISAESLKPEAGVKRQLIVTLPLNVLKIIATSVLLILTSGQSVSSLMTPMRLVNK